MGRHGDYGDYYYDAVKKYHEHECKSSEDHFSRFLFYTMPITGLVTLLIIILTAMVVWG